MFFATPPSRNGPLWNDADPDNAASRVLNCSSPLHSAVTFMVLRVPWSQGVGCWETTYNARASREAASGHVSF